jgi:hypothetical protein
LILVQSLASNESRADLTPFHVPGVRLQGGEGLGRFACLSDVARPHLLMFKLTVFRLTPACTVGVSILGIAIGIEPHPISVAIPILICVIDNRPQRVYCSSS